MVKVICEKTGIEFEASSKRTKNHPSIMAVLNEASRDGWYGSALNALKAGREQNFTTVEQFINAMREAGQSAVAIQHAEIDERVRREREAKEARRQRAITNDLLRGRGYHWK